LHRHHIEEAVDEFRSVNAINGAQVDSGDAVGEDGGHADEEPALDDFDDVVLEPAEGGGDGEADEEDGGENEKGLKERSALSAKGDVTDQGVHGEGECQVEQAGDQTEQDDGPDIWHLRAHEAEETPSGGNVSVMMCVGGMGGGFSGPFWADDAHFYDAVVTGQTETLGDFDSRERGDFDRTIGDADSGAEEAVFSDDEPTIFSGRPCNDGHVHIGLPNGVCDGGAGRGDVKADFLCCGGEEFQWIARGAEGIVDGLGGAFAVERNIGERGEVSDRQDVGVAVRSGGRARGRGEAHAVR